ncbi:MAG: phosphoribosylglycinamide formyltransferase, partial [Phycisphaerales bacterium]|nr:phosphoribosylglycinamide formyltransferase [Phycisphaerales bacterium]
MEAREAPAASEARGLSRLCVMLSGGGRTMLNLADAIDRGDLPATVALVVASKECPGAERARERGLRTVVVPGVIPRETLPALLDEHRIDWVVLAGYLKIVQIPEAYRGRVVNIHPALLPDFGGPGMYGGRVHAAVLASGATHSGCTVHLCDDEYDRGPILLQRTCPVLEGDDVHTLAARVFEEEMRAFPEALRRLIEAGH